MRATIQSMLQSVLALFDRRSDETRSELLEMLETRTSTQSPVQRRYALAAGPSTRNPTRRPAPIAKKRRADGSEWSETQPWCHL